MAFAIVLVGWVLSVCIHEFAHSIVAYAGGDTTVKDKGYLTFNPLKYTHPFYSILMPLLFLFMGGLGLPGGAVYIEEWRLRSRLWRSAMSLAGASANFLLAIVLAVVLSFAPEEGGRIWRALAFLMLLQVTSVFLNLIPLPPLDGYKAVAAWLPADLKRKMDAAGHWTLWILVLVFWHVEAVSVAFWTAVGLTMYVMGVSPEWAIQGLQEFRFWVAA